MANVCGPAALALKQFLETVVVPLGHEVPLWNYAGETIETRGR